MMVVDILLSLILVVLICMNVLAILAWQKVKVFLTWNTRYQSAAYEEAVSAPKIKRPSLPGKKSDNRGRVPKDMDELVDLSDIDWKTGYKALEDALNGS